MRFVTGDNFTGFYSEFSIKRADLYSKKRNKVTFDPSRWIEMLASEISF